MKLLFSCRHHHRVVGVVLWWLSFFGGWTTTTTTTTIVVSAWGREGHEIVGNLAWMLIQEQTQRTIQSILDSTTSSTTTVLHDYNNDCLEHCSPLAQIADWADQARYSQAYHWSGPLHYIDIQDNNNTMTCAVTDHPKESNCQFEYDRDCINDVCVAGAIVNYTTRLLPQQVGGGGEDGNDDNTNHNNNNVPFETKGATMSAYWMRTSHANEQEQRRRSLRSVGSSPFTFQIAKEKNDKFGSNQNQHVWSHNEDDDNDNKNDKDPHELKESLMFLTHFVGDIHQPLHCSRTTDRGGNSIQVNYFHDNKNTTTTTTNLGRKRHPHDLNLHAVWDDSIIETTLQQDYDNSRNSMEFDLYNYILQVKRQHYDDIYNNIWLKCPDGSRVECTIQWGEESLQAALQYAYRNVDGNEIVSGTNLTHEYYTTRLPIVRERLAMAGVRLAVTLDLTLL